MKIWKILLVAAGLTAAAAVGVKVVDDMNSPIDDIEGDDTVDLPPTEEEQ